MLADTSYLRSSLMSRTVNENEILHKNILVVLIPHFIKVRTPPSEVCLCWLEMPVQQPKLKSMSGPRRICSGS